MENNNGKGIFYGVIGVATLIVAIIGATFAYFSAQTISGQYVTGSAAVANLGVAVTRLTTFSAGEIGKDASTANYILVPQLDATLDQAIVGIGENGTGGVAGTNTGACIDENGSLVCSIYKIEVSNLGSSAIDVSGSITFYTGPKEGNLPGNGDDNVEFEEDETSVMNHLKWARLARPTDVSGAVLPTELLDYAEDEEYETIRPVALDGEGFANTSATPYLYGRSVTTSANDLYGADYSSISGTTTAESLWITSHAAHYDLIDPTDDLTRNQKVWTLNDARKEGSIHLQAGGYTQDNNSDGVNDDKYVFYIVVWISENLANQNQVDTGSFVGQVKFESAGGSGATSTFTEVAQG